MLLRRKGWSVGGFDFCCCFVSGIVVGVFFCCGFKSVVLLKSG